MVRRRVFVCLLLFGLGLFGGAWADAAGEEEYDYYALDDKNVSIKEYKGGGGAVTVPGALDGKAVIKVGESCFADNLDVTEITIPEGVTYIADGAFAGCRRLETIHLPDSVQYIGYGVFNGSGVRSLRIPKGVKTWDHALVEACPNLEEVVLTDLERVALWGGAEEMGSVAMEQINALVHACPQLAAFKVENEDSSFFTLDGVLFHRSLATIELEEVERVTLIAYPPGKRDKTYYMPDKVDEVRDRAFWGCQYLEKLVVPKSVIRMRLEIEAKNAVTVVVLGQTALRAVEYVEPYMYYADARISLEVPLVNGYFKTFAEECQVPLKELSEEYDYDKVATVEGLGVARPDGGDARAEDEGDGEVAEEGSPSASVASDEDGASGVGGDAATDGKDAGGVGGASLEDGKADRLVTVAIIIVVAVAALAAAIVAALAISRKRKRDAEKRKLRFSREGAL